MSRTRSDRFSDASSRRRSFSRPHGPVAAAAALVLLIAACGDDNGAADAEERDAAVEEDPDLEAEDLPVASGEVEPAPDLDDLDLSLTEIAQLDEPLALVPRPADDAHLFVAERDGRVLRLAAEGEGTDRTYTPDPEPVVDVGDELMTDGEQGLLGLAFSPDGSRLYLSYSAAPDGDTRVVSYDYLPDGGAPDEEAEDAGDQGEGEAGEDEGEGGEAEDAGEDEDAEGDEASDDEASEDEASEDEAATDEAEDADSAPAAGVDEDSRRDVLTVGQYASNHNGGQLLFGPDDYLYVALGDGGQANDPEENGQDLTTLLGSILRIDPEGAIADGADDPYLIPEDNPFADGADGARPEIWLHGVRNPWRNSFDAVTGDLWIADVGQGAWEELNLLPAEDEDHPGGSGANLGWSEMEASYPFEGGSNPPGGVLPVFEYPIHEEPRNACAVTGGYVYSGPAIPGLDGAYLYGDYCDPQVRALTIEGGVVTGETPLDDIEVDGLVSFGQDAENELYLLSQAGTIYRLDP